MAIFAAFIPPGELHPPQRASCCSSEALLGHGALEMLLISHATRCRSRMGVQGARGYWGRHQTLRPHSGQASKGTAGPPVRGEMGKLQECHSSRRSSSLLKASTASPQATELPEGEKS